MPLFDPAARSAPFAAAVLGAALLLAAAGSPIRAAEPEAARVIVKFKSGSSLARMQALSLAGDETGTRVRTLAARTGLGLRGGLALGERSQVMTASGMASAELANRLAADPDVEYAVVDRRRRLLAAPNDPLYAVGGTSGPVAGQWYLRPPNTTTPAAINAESAWDTTTGSTSIVVAVLDTGVRFDHADMARVGSGGNLLAGYDFVSDVPTANDGDGRDADASDPGDWITSAENATGGAFAACGVSDSSWHGTEVSGLIGATTNNGVGMASVGRNVRVLPVRVLGKCGGFDSDIIAGMRWAAGLTVPGVPANTTPAKVINMSLGGEGTCSSAYANVVSELTAAGVTIVASAGNSAGHAVSEPANCSGVIGVGGLRHVGTKVGFSDLGPQLSISAPGGNCVDVRAGAACQYPILTARNAGTTTPVAGSSVYSDSFAATVGTSFSSPLVAATAGLMLSLKPAMTPTEVRSVLQQTARAFPTTGGDNGDGTVVPQCQAPQFGANGAAIDQLQCYCTTATCGAGMLDAGAAVRAVAATVVTTPTPTPTPTPVADSDSGGGGGGAVSWPWLLLLTAAVLALRRAQPERVGLSADRR
jgi:serine protease